MYAKGFIYVNDYYITSNDLCHKLNSRSMQKTWYACCRWLMKTTGDVKSTILDVFKNRMLNPHQVPWLC